MNRMILSKKGTKPGVLVGMCIILAAVGVLMFIFNDSPFAMLADGADFARFMSLAAPALCIVAAIFVGACAGRYGSAYINIYDDHIEGNGLLSKGGMRAQNFSLMNGQYTIAVEGTTYICVQCNGTNYYLHFTEEDAKQVVACINGTYRGPQQQYQQQQYQQRTGQQQQNQQYRPKQQTQTPNQIISCPYCSAKCRVPSGRGNIVINCPKCGKKFNANT